MRPRPLVTAGVLAAATVLVITGAAGCRRKASPPPAPAPAPIVAPTAMQLPDDAAWSAVRDRLRRAGLR